MSHVTVVTSLSGWHWGVWPNRLGDDAGQHPFVVGVLLEEVAG